MTDFDAFFNGYLEAMAWANTMEVEDGEYTSATDAAPADFPEDIVAEMRTDARAFFDAAEKAEDPAVRAEWSKYVETVGYETAGFDFALSRNGHGAGFFDREDGFPALQRLAKTWGESTVMFHEDGTASIG